MIDDSRYIYRILLKQYKCPDHTRHCNQCCVRLNLNNCTDVTTARQRMPSSPKWSGHRMHHLNRRSCTLSMSALLSEHIQLRAKSLCQFNAATGCISNGVRASVCACVCACMNGVTCDEQHAMAAYTFDCTSRLHCTVRHCSARQRMAALSAA